MDEGIGATISFPQISITIETAVTPAGRAPSLRRKLINSAAGSPVIR